MLEIENLFLTYKDGNENREVLKNVSYKFGDGIFYTLLGPSGSGKSSLIYILSLLRKATSGSIILEGNKISAKSDMYKIRYENFGFIFQQHFLIPYLSVLENVCMASYNPKKIKDDAIEILKDLGLEEHMNKKPYQLSGGQKQRVSIARALVKKPKYIFADEPTASLDHKTAIKVMKLLEKACANSTVICTTHDTTIVPPKSTRLYLSDGKVIECK